MTEKAVDQGNETNMAQVRELMSKAQAVNTGNQLTEGVPIDFTTEYGTHYEGNIVFKRPSMQDYMKMGALKAQILGQHGAVDMRLVDGTIKFMAQVMSSIMVVVVKAPHWLIREGRISVDHIEEPDILYHIYGKFEDWEATFRKPVQGELQGDSPASE